MINPSPPFLIAWKTRSSRILLIISMIPTRLSPSPPSLSLLFNVSLAIPSFFRYFLIPFPLPLLSVSSSHSLSFLSFLALPYPTVLLLSPLLPSSPISLPFLITPFPSFCVLLLMKKEYKNTPPSTSDLFQTPGISSPYPSLYFYFYYLTHYLSLHLFLYGYLSLRRFQLCKEFCKND